ncbi:hypothetical protein DEU56DRAFT_832730 [Suillus clintonianus]|uniref:uncharacterized protein n=1 Tax=Suillus clintonianus TaxID=1904413 RepID=UPI001B8719EF|nr:uncharacterized protein DEU56DRAFT_832730 [Suillus clintonianus]KAG2122235.1 hypothetical protein DEU56DRAFT_832730 [Suillus clintonianus]
MSARRLTHTTMSQEDQDLHLPNIDWPKLRDTILASSIYALTKVDNWSIRHPYVAAGALIWISDSPEILLTPLRLTAKTARFICLLPLRLILWPFKLSGRFILYIFGFRREGVARDSLASQYQSHHYGGYVPRDSTFARFQSYGATDYYDDSDIEEAIRSMEADEARRMRLMDPGHYENGDPEAGSMLPVAVSWMSAIGAGFVLGRTWGWWN